MIKINVSRTCAEATQRERLTSGMQGVELSFSFSADWDDLVKTAVFEGSGRRIALTNIGDSCIIPHEVLAKHGGALRVGVYGRTADGSAATPTVYAQLGIIQRGADPNADPSTKPTLPVWAQIQAQIGDMSALETEAKDSLVAAINEAAKSGGGSGGKDGTGIESITYKGEDESGGNMYTVLLTDGTSYDITAPKGAAGADGITPTIGDNGNWHLGTTDTGKPSRGEKGEDAAADLTLGLTGATVGQIAKITAVDASGVPAAWEPVDMPSGGGGEWRKVIDAEVTEPTVEFIRDGLNGATELHIAWSNLQNASTSDSGLSVKINGILVGTYKTAALVQKNGSTIYGWTHLKFDGLHWILCKPSGAVLTSNLAPSSAYTVYNLIDNVGAANTIRFEAPITQYAPISGKLEVWAR